MSETKKLLHQLDEKVTELMGRVTAANEKVNQLEEENQALKSEMTEKEKAFTALQQQIESQKNEGQQSEEDVKERIGEMVKEIDRCISLLKV